MTIKRTNWKRPQGARGFWANFHSICPKCVLHKMWIQILVLNRPKRLVIIDSFWLNKESFKIWLDIWQHRRKSLYVLTYEEKLILAENSQASRQFIAKIFIGLLIRTIIFKLQKNKKINCFAIFFFMILIQNFLMPFTSFNLYSSKPELLLQFHQVWLAVFCPIVLLSKLGSWQHDVRAEWKKILWAR